MQEMQIITKGATLACRTFKLGGPYGAKVQIHVISHHLKGLIGSKVVHA